MAVPLLTLTDAAVTFGGQALFDGLGLSIAEGDRICLLGRNGSGKSTLMKTMAGLVDLDGGELFVKPGLRLAYLPQEPSAAGHVTVAALIASGLPDGGDGSDDYRVASALQDVGLQGDADPNVLSGGELKRAAIARAFAGEPDILLLDEPTNHLDIEAISWLEEKLAGWRGALVVISHDRAFLRALTSVCFWLDRGRLHRLDQGYAHFEAWQADLLEKEATELAKMDKLLAEETRWSRQGISARRRRNQGRLRRLQQLRKERAEVLGRSQMSGLDLAHAGKSGALVTEADGVTHGYDNRVLFDDFSTRIMRGDKVGIVGPNGAGKTTLLKTLTGALTPRSGRVRLGTNLKMLTISQQREQLDPDLTLWETLTGGTADHLLVNGQSRHVVAYLKDFLFDAAQARSPVRALSGGERNRLLLARSLAQPANFLILDEPTNDLDMETLDLLQEILAEFDGTVLVVSHDRDFLDRVVTSTIVLEGAGKVREYAGGYTDMLAQRGEPPHRRPADKKTTSRRVASNEPASTPVKPNAHKLSFKEEQALAHLPQEMARKQKLIGKLEGLLADPELFTRDPKKFTAATEALQKTRNELDALETEWLDLEIKRETVANRR